MQPRPRHPDFPPGPNVRIVSAAELANSEFVRDVRALGYGLGLRPGEWLEFILTTAARFEGRFVDKSGRVVDLPFEVFEPTDAQIDHGLGGLVERRMTDWFEATFCTPCGAQVRPHVRVEARPRFVICATVLKARFPVLAAMWGVRAANDDEPQP